MYILIDNYDSFTYILHHYLLQTGHECVVYKNDEVTIDELIALNPERIIISPGPETPLQAGITMDVIAHFRDKLPILGVCLGHQALGMYFGAQLVHAAPMHGKTSKVDHKGHELFKGIMSPFTVMRYHSLAIEGIAGTELDVIATTGDGIIMALAHKKYPVMGVQFHPESVGTEHGLQLLKNWAAMKF
ncbi:anthranilate/aminodeoxychorismate synthase component II [Flavipsychrobacter stenotrophus]|uniref:Anthranilate/aminodeoxychorismate synthase component II n=1 Tax=Flavipsychrobacter stenotrophus TaxID=2077091 RepID=A0A2S7SWC9_9BACT|nr:aminodeoxychorismate/anthranilate synthase component II [Flavipsychrobacter stenotrophus]PQJ10921.1 anthranilate/aminodeoxychorismate synthase component II [Flavipsychrobacter stenotrophus]